MIIPCRSVWIGNIFTDRVTVCPHSTLCDILMKKIIKIMRTFMRGAAGAGGQLPPLLFFDLLIYLIIIIFCCCCLNLSAQRSVMSMMIIPRPHYERFFGGKIEVGKICRSPTPSSHHILTTSRQLLVTQLRFRYMFLAASWEHLDSFVNPLDYNLTSSLLVYTEFFPPALSKNGQV